MRHEGASHRISFLQVVFRLPQMLGMIVRLAWAADRRALVTVVAAELVRGAALAFGLLTVNRVFVSLLASGPTPDKLHTALPPLMLMGAAAAIGVGAGSLSTAAAGRLEPKVERTTTVQFLERAIRVELLAIEDPEFHRLLDSAEYGTRAARQMIGQTVAVANACLTLAAAGGVLAVLHPALLPLLALIAAPKGWGAVRTARRRYESTLAWVQHARASTVVAKLLTDPLVAPEVRVHGAGSFLLRHFEGMSADAEAEQTRLARSQASTDLAAASLSGIASAVAYLTLGLLLNSGIMDLAVAATAALAIRSGAANITTFVTQINGLYREALFLQDLQEVCIEGDRRAIPEGGTAPRATPEVIRLHNVSFTYPGRGRPAVNNVSLTIRRGQVVALVGENGSGKTTIAKLVAGLYEPDDGTLTWDGTDVRELDREQVFSKIGLLTQDFPRWPFTAQANIAIGNPQLPVETHALTASAHYANIDQMIKNLPKKWDTLLARQFTGGVELSGGQWQRLGLARAHYRSAPILICDEPTSALDPKAEIEAFEKIRALTDQGHTIVLITHRLASVRHADTIYMLSNGQLIESGTHQQLLGQEGRFAELFHLQANQYQPPDHP
ncbi:ABC transporter ATP-binding protein [Streptomyces sp. 3211]|uniref:ABC transporter ATP-binding protein n=1 Tax=Streptomyces sp. 3211 TaxID=1964449 RepID=UPI00179A76BE|nr:ABC transporter ATP-binding protein [Streptomyces sp. 3211]